jgi:glycosyltransferase involved in cell wall biosynthesis
MIFISWKKYQRRTEAISHLLELRPYFIYKSWEETTKVHKAFSYIFKAYKTLHILFKCRSEIVFVQLPPAMVLYCIGIYRLFRRDVFLFLDCHNDMIVGRWLKWPFITKMMKTSNVIITHNEEINQVALDRSFNSVYLADPLPLIEVQLEKTVLNTLDLKDDYVFMPWSFSADEPIELIIQLATQQRDRKFVFSWFRERLRFHYKGPIPDNVIFTGFLKTDDYNVLFHNATCVIILTNRPGTQPSAMSEALAMAVPAILSDHSLTRKLYGSAPYYVQHTVDEIKNGIDAIQKNRYDYVEAMKILRMLYSTQVTSGYNQLTEIIKNRKL